MSRLRRVWGIKSLGNRIALFSVVTTIFISTWGALVYDRWIVHQLKLDAQDFLKAKSHSIQLAVDEIKQHPDVLQKELQWNQPSLQYGQTYVQVRSFDHKIDKSSPFSDQILGKLNTDSIDPNAFPQFREFQTDRGTPIISYTQVVWDDQKRPRFFLRVSLDFLKAKQLIEQQRQRLKSILLFGVFFTFAAALWLRSLALKPIQKLSDSTLTLDQVHQVPLNVLDYPIELAPLVQALNHLKRRVSEQISSLSRFAENAAHELRNPISIMIAEAEITLSRPRDAKEYTDVLQSSLEELQHLSSVVDGLLFIARAENRTLSTRFSYMKMERTLRDVVDMYEPLLEERHVRLLLELQKQSDDKDLQFFGDEVLVKRAFGNLLSNAIAYGTTASHPEVRVGYLLSPTEMQIWVQDNGQGIELKDIPLIFERFHRSHSAIVQRREGCGLGLSIVKSIMDVHGGSVHVTLVQPGTRFELRFPMRKSNA